MSTRINFSFFLIAAFAVIAVAGRSAAQTDISAPANVLVTNSTAQAVPVKAANTFPVNLTNTANVHAFITNASTSPVPTIKDEDKNVFRSYRLLTITPGNHYASVPFVVPAGKRLVIDYIAGVVFPGSGAEPANLCGVLVSSNQGMNEQADVGVAMPLLPGEGDGSAGSASMHVTCESGESVYPFLERASANTAGTCTGSITVCGHYVPVP